MFDGVKHSFNSEYKDSYNKLKNIQNLLHIILYKTTMPQIQQNQTEWLNTTNNNYHFIVSSEYHLIHGNKYASWKEAWVTG
jgi:hypothetical protein